MKVEVPACIGRSSRIQTTQTDGRTNKQFRYNGIASECFRKLNESNRLGHMRFKVIMCIGATGNASC